MDFCFITIEKRFKSPLYKEFITLKDYNHAYSSSYVKFTLLVIIN